MRGAVSLVMAVLMILTAAPALSKGPSSATVTGPGSDEPIELLDYPDHDLESRDQVAALMRMTGVWYGNMGLEETTEHAPDVELGPAYILTWFSEANPGDPGDDFTIRQILYPHAEEGPVVHTPPQPALDEESHTLGWRTAPDEINDTLRRLGVPIGNQTPTGVHAGRALLALLASALITAVLLVNSRHRPVVTYQ